MNFVIKYIPVFLLSLLLLLGFPGEIYAQGDYSLGVAKISVGDQIGAGLLVGYDKEKVYIISTHKLIQKQGTGNQKIDVRLSDQIPVFPAKLVQSSEFLDLAVIEIEVREMFNLQYIMTKEFNLQVSQSLKVIGHTLENEWEENFMNRIKKRDAPKNADQLILSSYGLAGGYLGSPVFTENYEWVGMLTDIGNRNSTALKANTILKALESWQIPANSILSVISNLQDRIYISNNKVDQKTNIPIELESQEIFILVNSFDVVLTKKGKEVKNIAPLTIEPGKRRYEFPLSRKLLSSRKYALKYEIDGQEFYSEKIQIGKPSPREIGLAALFVGLGVFIYSATRSLPDPPDPFDTPN